MKQALKAGLNAATISIVLRTAPEIINAIKYLIENGEVDEEQFKKIGFAALKVARKALYEEPSQPQLPLHVNRVYLERHLRVWIRPL